MLNAALSPNLSVIATTIMMSSNLQAMDMHFRPNHLLSAHRCLTKESRKELISLFIMTQETTCFSKTSQWILRTYIEIQTRGFCNWGVDHGIMITVPKLDSPNIYQFPLVPR
ncbi:uncharacterized protein BJ212DRAFT_497021 [Suillus subaureus]|uniref:Uncharacterized protein n=1 Tax=Suillus subaureus TaxID=48587 RepID=A0A9P7E5J0_9AGAM|nr:uncharacterized protein BJ212DRAFT_497021 [Suillus subaureus]KAG1811854.1 hypothetical protein BJ212DRAFT_497021 [Suillus subaureus]